MLFRSEIAMRGGEDPDNRHDFPGGFPGDSANAFQSSGRTPEEADVFEDVSRLMHFRAEHPALLTGQQQDLFADDSAFVFLRSADIHSGCTVDGPTRILVAINKANQPRELSIPTPLTALENCTQLKPELGAPSASGSLAKSVTLMLGPMEAAIYSVR